jgi:hypothetical protein
MGALGHKHADTVDLNRLTHNKRELEGAWKEAS